MVDPATGATLLIAGGASFFMAWTIGAGSSGSTPFAPAVGANAVGVMRAGFIVGILGFLGAVIQGGNVSQAVGHELIHDVALSPIAATLALTIAAVLVAIGLFKGYPIATAFTVTGAVIGVGVALGGAPAWVKYQEIGIFWLITPIIGGSLAYATAVLLQSKHTNEIYIVTGLAGVIGLIIANIDFVFLGQTGTSQSLAITAGEMFPNPVITTIPLASIAVSVCCAVLFATIIAIDLMVDASAGQKHFLLVLGGLVAFSAGGSQVGLAIGPLLPMLSPFSIPLIGILVGGGVGLLVGSWMGAPRLIKALSQDYSSLGPRRSTAALIPAFAIAQTAILFGIPVSFNEIIVSTIVGSGATADSAGISRRKVIYTGAAWIGSLGLALILGYSTFTVFATL